MQTLDNKKRKQISGSHLRVNEHGRVSLCLSDCCCHPSLAICCSDIADNDDLPEAVLELSVYIFTAFDLFPSV